MITKICQVIPINSTNLGHSSLFGIYANELNINATCHFIFQVQHEIYISSHKVNYFQSCGVKIWILNLCKLQVTHSNNFVVINQCTFILNPILTNWHHRKNIPQDSEAPYHASHIKSTTIIWGTYRCCHCTLDYTKVSLSGVTPCRHSFV